MSSPKIKDSNKQSETKKDAVEVAVNRRSTLRWRDYNLLKTLHKHATKAWHILERGECIVFRVTAKKRAEMGIIYVL